MNYQRHYDNLIETRKTRTHQPGVYYENHHIVMKSMGETDDPENMVKLTAREHFLAHWLLWRSHRNRSTACAFLCMSTLNTSAGRIKMSSRMYAESREAGAKFLSELKKGVPTGRSISPELRKKLNESRKGKKYGAYSEERRKSMSLAQRKFNASEAGKLSVQRREETRKHNGYETSSHRNTIWVTNGIISKRINSSDLSNFPDWKKGRRSYQNI